MTSTMNRVTTREEARNMGFLEDDFSSEENDMDEPLSIDDFKSYHHRYRNEYDGDQG